MNKDIIPLGYRKRVSMFEGVMYFSLSLLVIILCVILIIWARQEYRSGYSFYFLLSFGLLIGGLALFLFIDTIFFLFKRRRNNIQREEAVYFDQRKRTFIFYALDGVYQIPASYIKKFRGHGLTGHSLLSVLYDNKKKKGQFLQIGYVEHIRALKMKLREYR